MRLSALRHPSRAVECPHWSGERRPLWIEKPPLIAVRSAVKVDHPLTLTVAMRAPALAAQ